MKHHEIHVPGSFYHEDLKNLPKEVLLKKLNFHLCQKWDSSNNDELMFQLKQILSENGEVYIPVNFDDISKENKSRLCSQVEKGEKTRLYLTNFDSLHVRKISKIYQRTKKDFFNKNRHLIHPDFNHEKYKFYHWLKLEDMYLLHASHFDNVEELQAELSLLKSVKDMEELNVGLMDDDYPLVIVDTSNLCIFNMINRQQFDEQFDEQSEDGRFLKWIETNRSFTSDYYVKSCFLRDSIYQSAWPKFQKGTKHFLINAEKASQQKFDLNSMIEYLIGAKSDIFSLRRKFHNKYEKEDFLFADQVLLYQEKKIDLFYRSKLLNMLEDLNVVILWFKEHLPNLLETGSNNEVMNNVNKVNEVFSRLCSSSFEENLLLQIHKETHGALNGDKSLKRLVDDFRTPVLPIKKVA